MCGRRAGLGWVAINWLPFILVASAAAQDSIELQPRGTLPGHKGGTWKLAFCDSGSLLLSSGGDGAIRVWDVERGVLERALEVPGAYAAFTDSRGPRRILDFALGPGCQTIAETSSEQHGAYKLRLWDLNAGTQTPLLQQDDNVTRVAYSPRGDLIALTRRPPGEFEYDVVLLRPHGGEQVAELCAGVGLAFSPDGTLLVCGVGNDVLLWDVDGQKELGRLSGHTAEVRNAIFSRTGTLLVTQAGDSTIRVWAAPYWQIVSVIHTSSSGSLALRPDGRMLATGNTDGVLRLYDPIDGRRTSTQSCDGGRTGRLAFSADGDILAAGGDDGRIRLWTVRAARPSH
jgi:WD40 repeat protein